MKNKLIVLSGFVFSLVPVVAMATGQVTTSCSAATVDTIEEVLCRIGDILNLLIPILIALGVVYFIWGVVSYVIASDEEAKKSGKNRMIYGIIGFAVIIALWGLVKILTNTFGVDNSGTVTLPTIGEF